MSCSEQRTIQFEEGNLTTADQQEIIPGFIIDHSNEPEHPITQLQIADSIGGSDDFGLVTGLGVEGHFLFISDQFRDPHLAVAEIPTRNLVGRIGTHGQGPGEFRSPNEALQVGLEDKITVFDFSNQRIAVLSTEDGDPHVVSEVNLIADRRIINAALIEGEFIGNTLSYPSTLIRIDTTTFSSTLLTIPLAFSLEDVQGHHTGARLINRTFLSFRPDGSPVIAHQFSPMIDLIDLHDDESIRIIGPYQAQVSFQIADNRFIWNDDNEMAYSGITTSGGHIYALYCGCRIEEERNATQVIVFDAATGRLVGEYSLDREITALAVDKQSGLLFGAIQHPWPMVGLWDLPAAREN